MHEEGLILIIRANVSRATFQKNYCENEIKNITYQCYDR